MNRKPYREVLDSAAADSLSRNTNLMPKISARLERKPFIMTLRTRPILALLIAFLVLSALSGAVYALGRTLGYIPGVGVVDQSAPVRVLAEPLTLQQRGISVTVSKVVADSTRTFVSYHVEGIPLVTNEIPACTGMPELHLSDGSNLENRTPSGGTALRRAGDSMYYSADAVYAPMPEGSSEVLFLFSCTLPEGAGTENFRLPLSLVPAPAGYATPAVEIVVTDPGGEATTGLHLIRVLELETSYILVGKFVDGGDLGGPLYMTTSSDSEYLPRIEDANGEPVPFKVREDVRPEPQWDVAYYWAYEIPKPVAAPLTITVDQVNIRQNSTTQMLFEAGEQPQAGQEWELNQSVSLGGYTFNLEKMTFLGNGYVLSFSYEALPPNVTFYVDLVDDPANPFPFEHRNETTRQSGNEMLHTVQWTAQDPPAGQWTLQWMLEEAIPQPGPWSLEWTPANP